MMAQLHSRNNPFPGLRPFELDEEHLFFGREDQADELLKRLTRSHFLGIVGTSGSGKSSLVRAGLLPALYSGLLTEASSSWRVALLRPGNAPIRNLAEALNAHGVFGADIAGDDDNIHLALTESTLLRGSLGLVEAAQQARMAPHENLLVVIDQFEELFRFKQQAQSLEAKDEAVAFVKLLLSSAHQRDVPIFVVLTMRSDFLGDCAQFRDLPEALNDNQYLVPRLARDQLRRVIEGPVAVSGATITPTLVNCLLNNVGDSPDQLPILQHALMQTWDYWTRENTDQLPINISHYEAIGGMDRALSVHADRIYLTLPDQTSRKIAEAIFKRLTEKGLDNREVRRPAPLSELCLISDADPTKTISIIEKFREHGASFLMPPPRIKLQEDTVVDISQESLMRIWDRLQDWMSEENENSFVYRRLAETTRLYYNRKASLLRDPELQISLKWKEKFGNNFYWASRYSNNFEQVIDFIEESKEKEGIEDASRNRTIRDKYLKSTILAIALCLSTLVGFGFSRVISLLMSGSQSIDVSAWISSTFFRIVAPIIFITTLGYCFAAIRLVKEGNAAIVERLGRYRGTLTSGLNFIVPFLDSLVFVASLRDQRLSVLPQKATSRDNVTFDVGATIHWRVYNLERVYYSVDNVQHAMEELLMTTLRSEVGKMYFHSISSSREVINNALFDGLCEVVIPWGVKLDRVEIHRHNVTSIRYIVPLRSRENWLDQLTSAVPFTVLMVMFGISLAAAVALASPTTALWLGVSNLMITLLRTLFVTIVFSLAIAFVSELSQ